MYNTVTVCYIASDMLQPAAVHTSMEGMLDYDCAPFMLYLQHKALVVVMQRAARFDLALHMPCCA